ncbi:hypothetical protein D3C73_1031380 [compost metagenome]
MTGTMISSIKPVEMMIRLRCCTATSPDGESSTALHPASNGRAAIQINPRSLGRDDMAIPRNVTVGSKRNTTLEAAKNLG